MNFKRWIARGPLILWRMGWHGILGHFWLLITTVGRKSGLPRFALLEYHYLDGSIYIPSGKGNRSQWVKNLSEWSEVTIQTSGKPRHAIATSVTDVDEVARLLGVIHRRNPFFKKFFKLTGIEKPDPQLIVDSPDKLVFVRLEPGPHGPPSMKHDLVWVNLVLLFLLWCFLNTFHFWH
jgi:deazaflavin-dependent oxidoreductase (nitroreductase family)